MRRESSIRQNNCFYPDIQYQYPCLAAQNNGQSEYLDKNNCFAGWKTLFSKSNTALIYNKVDFGNEKVAEITVRAKSPKGGVLVVRADGKKGNIIAKVKIPKSAAWKNVRAQVLHAPQGVHALHVSLQSGADVEVDWLGFI